MKVKKNGWGTTEMLVLSGGLLLALLVSIYFISKLYSSLDISMNSSTYTNLETKLETAAKNYVIDNNITITGTTRITLSTLKNSDLIDEFDDANGDACNGYVLVQQIDDTNYYSAYISCNDYITTNY